jgi:Fe-S-cluster containining protein
MQDIMAIPKRLRITQGYKKLDYAIAKAIKSTNHAPSCFKGCSFCCHIHVTVTKAEADACVTYAKANNVDIDYKLLQAQQGLVMENWKSIPYNMRKCVFLKDNACSVYEYRPINCRKYYVVTDPKLCSTELHTMETVETKDVAVGAHLTVEVLAMALSYVLADNGNLNLVGSFSKFIKP